MKFYNKYPQTFTVLILAVMFFGFSVFVFSQEAVKPYPLSGNDAVGVKMVIPECYDGIPKRIEGDRSLVEALGQMYRVYYLECVADKLMIAVEAARDFVPEPKEHNLLSWSSDGVTQSPIIMETPAQKLRKEADAKIKEAERLESLEKKAAEYNQIYRSIAKEISHDGERYPSERDIQKLSQEIEKANGKRP